MVRKTVIFVAVLSVASMGFAFTLPMGHVYMKLQDFTHLYDAQGQAVDFSQAPYNNPMNWVGLEIRAIFKVYSAGAVDGNGVFQQTWSPSAAEEVTGVFHNAQVSSVSITPIGPPLGNLISIQCSPLAPPPGPADQDFLNTPALPMPPSGGRVTLYADSTPDYKNDPDGLGGLPGPAQWTGYDLNNNLHYPTVTDGKIIIDGAMPELQLFYGAGTYGPGIIKIVQLFDGNKKGWSEYFINSINPNAQDSVLGGTIREDWAGQQPQWHTVPGSPIYGDGHGLTDLTWGNPAAWAGWFFQSQDPVEYYRIPEPATCVLLGGALLGLMRRRKRS